MLSTFEFHNRKPSIVQVRACIKNALKDNSTIIEILWGENRLYMDQDSRGVWSGNGWIKGISGYDLAAELNRSQAQKFVDNHFQFIAIR